MIFTDLINVENIKVLIDATDVSAYVKAETIAIKDTGGVEIETCSFIMRPVPSLTLEWKECQIVAELADESNVYLFAGFVTRPVNTFAENGVLTEIDVKAEGYKVMLARSKPFSAYWKGLTAEDVVSLLLFGADLAGFSAVAPASTVGYWDISLDESVAKNLDRFCKERGWTWRVTWQKIVVVGPASADTFSGWGLAEAQYANMTTLFPVESPAQESDASMVTNAILLKGGMATSDLQTQTFSGDDTTENFFLAVRPIYQIVSILLDGDVVSWGTLGYHNCSERDALVHFQGGYVRFCVAPKSGETVTVNYTYQFPYTHTSYDSASQTLYGQNLWTLVEAPWITDDVSAEAYADAVFAEAAIAPRRMTCDLRRVGPRAGQHIACRFPSLGVGTPSTSENMLIESIGTSAKGRHLIQTLRLGPATEQLGRTLESLTSGGSGYSAPAPVSTGGVSDHGDLSGLADDDHAQYLLGTGERAGASSQAQVFTNGIIGPVWKPATDSTTALQVQDAAGTAVATVDTTNRWIGVRTTPDNPLHVRLPAVGNNSYLKLSSDTASTFHSYLGTTANNQYAWFTNIRYSGSAWVRDNSNLSAWRMNQVVWPTSQFGLTHWSTTGVETSPLRILGTGDFGIGPMVGYSNMSGATIVGASGLIGIGLIAPSSKLHVLDTSALSNTAKTVVTFGHDTSDTPAAGFGSRVLWQLKSSTTGNQNAAAIEVLWNVATHNSQKADLVLSAYDTAQREGLRIRGDGSAAAIGFYGSAPTTRKTLAAYSSIIEDDVYAGLSNKNQGEVYAAVSDLNALRLAYENLRASYDNLRTQLIGTTLVA